MFFPALLGLAERGLGCLLEEQAKIGSIAAAPKQGENEPYYCN